MLLPKGAIVAVADGETLVMFRNDGDEREMKLRTLPDANVVSGAKGSGAMLDGTISDLVIIAAPRTLGELRKHYHKALTAILKHEIAKELTGHSLHDIE